MLLILIHFVLFSFDLVGFGLVYGLVWFSLVCWVWIVRLQCSLVYSAWFSLVWLQLLVLVSIFLVWFTLFHLRLVSLVLL